MEETNFKLINKGGFMQENSYQCEHCKEMFYEQSLEKWNYCPACGNKIVNIRSDSE